MGTQRLAQPMADKETRHTHRSSGDAAVFPVAGRLAILRGDIAALKREGVVALTRWYRYRKAVRQLSNCQDCALDEIGIDRSEIDITAYCIAEQEVNARPSMTPARGFVPRW